MVAVEFGADVNAQLQTPESIRGVFGVGAGAQQVSAKTHEHFHLSLVHGLNARRGVEAVFGGWAEVEFFAELLHEAVAHLFPDADGAVALHVAVAPHRAEAGAGTADLRS